MRNFSKLVVAHVGTFLGSKGFVYGDRVFRRTQDGGLINLVGFDSGRWNPNLFRIMLGFNDHSLPAPHLGFVHERYFTGGSISPSPRDLSCTTEKALRSRLDRFVALFDEVVEPFFASLASRSQLADALSDQTTMDYIRGLLYLADADADRAAHQLSLYLRRLRAVEAGADSRVQETIDHVEALLASCARPNE